jgi:rubrerythrin
MLKKIAKQILDEAVHFDLVAKVLEHLTGKEVDVQALLNSEAEGGGAKGARILENISKEDRLALHLYQFIAEGRAHRVWQRMADVCADPMIAKTYQKIANDERGHREFGRQGLSEVLKTEADQQRAMKLAQEIRLELYNVSCSNCVEVPAARQMVVEAYGPAFAH